MRRDCLAASPALPALLTSKAWAAGKTGLMVGIPVDARPNWSGAQNFIRSIDATAEESCNIARNYLRIYSSEASVPKRGWSLRNPECGAPLKDTQRQARR